MKRWQVIIGRPARLDIADAYAWIAERDPVAAALWFNSLHETIFSLDIFPERCPLAPEARFFKMEIRQIFHGRRHNKYRILFAVGENSVHVLHVRHGARLALGEHESTEE